MKNNKTLRLAQTECGAAATFPAHQGRAPSPQKSPRRSPTRASCATLVNALFWKILVTRVKHFVDLDGLMRVHARLRRAMAPRLEAWGRLILRDGRFAASEGGERAG